jgi:hypothetical protein
MRKTLLALLFLRPPQRNGQGPQPRGLTLPRERPMGTSNCGQWELPIGRGVIYLGSLEHGTKPRSWSERIHP